ncbi:MAG: hypothetical protein KJ607_00255 [Bacteroidetes bacterium]|nr:hypothetical protein [Bacteroidota bacterium]
MKKIFLLLLPAMLYAASFPVYAQYCAGYKNKGVKETGNTTTLVALTGDTYWDTAIKDAMEKYWKHSKFEFKHFDEIEQFIPDKSYSFLMPVTMKLITEQHQLAFFIGGKADITKYTPLHLVAYAIIDGMNLEKDYNECAYRLVHMIKSMNDAIDIAKEQQFSTGVGDKLMGYYNKKATGIKDKILLINKEYTGATLSEEDIKELYPYPFEIAGQEIIEKAIDAKDEKYCYMIKATTKNTYTFVFDCATGEVWYAESNDKLTKKDKIKQLADTVRGIE